MAVLLVLAAISIIRFISIHSYIGIVYWTKQKLKHAYGHKHTQQNRNNPNTHLLWRIL